MLTFDGEWKVETFVSGLTTRYETVAHYPLGGGDPNWFIRNPDPLPTEKREALWEIWDEYTTDSAYQEAMGLGFEEFVTAVRRVLA